MKVKLSHDPTCRYSYIADPQCPERILTIGRKLIDGHVVFTYCINKVVEELYYDSHVGTIGSTSILTEVIDNEYDNARVHKRVVLVYDEFNKEIARHVVSERHKNDDRRLSVEAPPKGGSNALAALKHLAEGKHPNISRRAAAIAKRAYRQFELAEAKARRQASKRRPKSVQPRADELHAQ